MSQSTQNTWQQDLIDRLFRPPPEHISVVIHLTISAFLAYVLCMADLPNAIPPSQRGFIPIVAPYFTMLLPSLMFVVGAGVFPGLMVMYFTALVFSTILLSCAAGVGKGFYVFMYAMFALLASGIRFNTKQGSMGSAMILMVASTTVGLAETAEKEGQDFVNSLWTETGLTNPNAVFTNGLLGFLWICIVLSAGRLLPPFKTARAAISKGLLPGTLREMSEYIQLISDALTEKVEEGARVGDGGKESRLKLIHNKPILAEGGIAGITAFEPRLLRCSPPECSWMVLQNLARATDKCLVSILTLPDLYEIHKYKDLVPVHQQAASVLKQCTQALAEGKHAPLDNKNETSGEETKTSSENNAFDPAYLERLSQDVATCTAAWVTVMDKPNRSNASSYVDKPARDAFLQNLRPWILGGFGIWPALVEQFLRPFQAAAWKDVKQDPTKLVWCIKFTVGLTALVIMSTYWDAFRDLEIPVGDEGSPAGAHFAGWTLTSYAFATTQTAEGTVKKGILRLLGTACGGFSAWLALTACGNNEVGLVAWLTVAFILAAWSAVETGFKARLGLADYAYGAGYFVMTQGLIVFEVYLGAGSKNDITTNRIVSNATGIAMAIVLALIPPAIWGGDPSHAKAVLRKEKEILSVCLTLLSKPISSGDMSAFESLVQEMERLQHDDHAVVKKLLGEANDFYKSASKWHQLPVYKVDPKLKIVLDGLDALGSWITLALVYLLRILKKNDLRESFLEGTAEHERLRALLGELQSDTSTLSTTDDAKEGAVIADIEIEDATSQRPEPDVFLHMVRIAIKHMKENESRLSSIRYGFVS